MPEDEIITFPCGDGLWAACYREDEGDDLGGFALSLNNPDPLLAEADLVARFPREVGQ